MLIEEMTRAECLKAIAGKRLGRLACSHQNQPYIVPVYFVYDDLCLYGFTTRGQKVQWMRSNPLVCVELDEIDATNQWMTIVILGTYEELLDSEEDGEMINRRQHAHSLLQQHAVWWEPGAALNKSRQPSQQFKPLFYRININQIHGRRAIPDRNG